MPRKTQGWEALPLRDGVVEENWLALRCPYTDCNMAEDQRVLYSRPLGKYRAGATWNQGGMGIAIVCSYCDRVWEIALGEHKGMFFLTSRRLTHMLRSTVSGKGVRDRWEEEHEDDSGGY